MNTLFMTVDNSVALVAAGYTSIRVYTDTSESGAFTTLDGTVALVSGTESYSYTDADGASTTWYKTCYFGAVPGESDKSAARYADTSSAYATVPELRAHIQLDSTTRDVELALLLDASKRSIDDFTNHPDGFVAVVTATARTYAGDGKPFLKIDDCVAITLVAVKDSPSDTSYVSWTTPSTAQAGDGDWIPFAGSAKQPNYNIIAQGRPYTKIMVDPNGDYYNFVSGKYGGRRGFRPTTTYARLLPTVQVTARWGYASTVPPTIKTACIMQAAIWHKRLQGSMASVLESDFGGQMRMFRDLDPAVKLLLVRGRYFRPSI